MEKKTLCPRTLQLCVSVAIITVGCSLLVAGFCVNPTGEIHNSVLVAFGEIMTFAGSFIGLDYHYRFRKNDTADSTDTRKHRPDDGPGKC
ncbi:MAG: hypothetical protein K2O24_00810 [Muribaculaceae bacterium]|nr:hypothetical protein [Muribaculaceae bacterium]